MKTWLLRRLNHEAKAWPYHSYDGIAMPDDKEKMHLRKKQRASIKHDLQTIRSALSSPSAHVHVGRGGNTLYFASGSTLANFGRYDLDTFLLCGIPVIDTTAAPIDKVAVWVMKEPMVRADMPRYKEGRHGLDYQGLVPYAQSAKAIGAVVANVPECDNAYERVIRHDDPDPQLDGWYIVSYDSTGETYDSVGPYETEEQATILMLDTSEV